MSPRSSQSVAVRSNCTTRSCAPWRTATSWTHLRRRRDGQRRRLSGRCPRRELRGGRAVDRFAPDLRPAGSGHNSHWTWGPPLEDATTAVAIGFPREQLELWFGRVELAARVDNGVDLD